MALEDCVSFDERRLEEDLGLWLSGVGTTVAPEVVSEAVQRASLAFPLAAPADSSECLFWRPTSFTRSDSLNSFMFSNLTRGKSGYGSPVMIMMMSGR